MTAGAAGRSNLGRHIIRAGELFVVEMSAFLRQQLVLDMNRRRARVLEGTHHMHHVQRLAITGVAIHQHGQPG